MAITLQRVVLQCYRRREQTRPELKRRCEECPLFRKDLRTADGWTITMETFPLTSTVPSGIIRAQHPTYGVLYIPAEGWSCAWIPDPGD